MSLEKKNIKNLDSKKKMNEEKEEEKKRKKNERFRRF
jgi:hypothetical protein